MNRPRPLLLLVVGSGALLLAGLPAAAGPADSRRRAAASASEDDALRLLGEAARAARTRTWSATSHVATFRGAAATSAVVDVHHDPGAGTRVQAGPDAPVLLPPAPLEEQLLAQLADRYRLSVTGSGACAGRTAHVVQAQRADGRIAARFWLDRDTGLPLRREVWDAQGNRLRSSALVDVRVEPLPEPGREATAASAPVVPDLLGLPTELPGGYVLFDVGRPVHDGVAVLHLTYSDGLSTVSVFSQPGSVGSAPAEGYVARRLDGGTIWVHPGTPERAVWGGGGRVFTLVSDAGEADLLAAVRALPRDRDPGGGVLPRLVRGLSRIGSWVDPLG